jgi:hypothetical protein
MFINNNAGDLSLSGQYNVIAADTLVTIHGKSGSNGVYMDGPAVRISPVLLSFFGAQGGGQQVCSILPSYASLSEAIGQINTLAYGLANLGLFYIYGG